MAILYRNAKLHPVRIQSCMDKLEAMNAFAKVVAFELFRSGARIGRDALGCEQGGDGA